MKFSGMTIGVPKEIMPGENRVSSTGNRREDGG